jgi:hypothetical protein
MFHYDPSLHFKIQIGVYFVINQHHDKLSAQSTDFTLCALTTHEDALFCDLRFFQVEEVHQEDS